MSTESITKKFVLNKKATERLAEILSNPQPVPKHLLDSKEYEEGLQILEQYYGHSSE